MRPVLISIDALVTIIMEMDKQQFVEEHGGLYLLAMGLLSAEQLMEKRAVGKLATSQESEDTQPMTFGEHPHHDLQKTHPLAGHAFHLLAGERWLKMGRAAACDICVPDESVSEVHCQLQAGEGGLLVCDLRSTNGTKVNLQRLPPDHAETVSDGDMVTVGRYSFQLFAAPTLYSTLRLIRALDSD